MNDPRKRWLHGVLDILVLSCLTRGEFDGPEIAHRIASTGLDRPQGALLYPELNRLEESGMVAGTIRATEGGSELRHYRLTLLGRGVLDHRRDLLLGFDRAVHALLAAEDVEETR